MSISSLSTKPTSISEKEDHYLEVYLPNDIKKYCWVNAPLQFILTLVIEKIHLQTFSNIQTPSNDVMCSITCSKYLEWATQLLHQNRTNLLHGNSDIFETCDGLIQSLTKLLEQEPHTHRDVKRQIKSLVNSLNGQVKAMHAVADFFNDLLKWYVSSVVLSFLQVALVRSSSSISNPLSYSYAKRLILLRYLWSNDYYNEFEFKEFNSYFKEYQTADDLMMTLMTSFGPYLPEGRAVPDLRQEIKKKCSSCSGESSTMDSGIDAGFYPDFIEARKLNLTPRHIIGTESDCCSKAYERIETWVMESSPALVVTRQQLVNYNAKTQEHEFVPAGFEPSGETTISTFEVSFKVVATLQWHGNFGQRDEGHYTCFRPGTNHS